MVHSFVHYKSCEPNDTRPISIPCCYNLSYLRRAYSAHQNGWEAMNIWMAAILLARVVGVDSDTMNTVATVWLGSRLL